MVGKAGDSAIPYALILAEQLSSSFLKYANQDDDGLEMSDDWETAIGCLDGLKQIVSTCKARPDIIAKIEHFALPVIGHSLTQLGMEVTDDGLDLLTLLLRFSEKVNPKAWLMLPVLCEMAVGHGSEDATLKEIEEKDGGWGYEFVPNMMLPFQNFIARDTDYFIENYLGLVLSTCEKIMAISSSRPNDEEVEFIVVAQIWLALLECSKRPKIDHVVPQLLEVLVRELSRNHKESDKRVKAMLLQVLAMLFFYNAPLVLSLLA